MTDLYTPLDIESYQTRMILLHPGDRGSIIRCELQRHSLINPPKYTALSYCWGDEANKRPIMVDNIQVMVTVNLEEALQQLREHHVALLWADALCINQADKQEKSLQVRNMKQVYAKAESIYIWLGPSNYDGTLSAMQFLRRVASDVPLRSNYHSHTLGSASIPKGNILVSQVNVHAESLSCQNCQMEFLAFRALLDLLNRPYWRRRWVIQEVTTATKARVVCGGEVLDLDDMSNALIRCSRANYWQPQHRSAYRFLRRILNFRKSYHDHENLRLCETILSTRDFCSKDDRDKIFALMGICKDGTELVPTPSYHRSVDLVAAEITRRLLHRNARFDLILVDPRNRRSTSSQLPTWSPDWFSENLSEDACAIAEEEPYLSRQYGVRSLQGDINTLHVQGIEVGTVVASTSILGSSSHLLPAPAQIPGGCLPSKLSNSNYYGRQTLVAILTCLLASGTMLNAPMPTNGSVHRHQLLQAIRPRSKYKTQDLDETKQPQTHPTEFHGWLLQNGKFLIRGRTLQDWMTKSYAWYYLQVPYVMVRLLPVAIAVTVVAFLLPGVSIAYTAFSDPYSVDSAPTSFLFLVISIGAVSLLSVAISTLVLIHKVKLAVRKVVASPPQSSTRLILMDTGALGMACSDVEVGDKVCLIAGCKRSGAILREKQIDGQTLHQVVGKSMVCMSRKDEQKYSAFFGRRRPSIEEDRVYRKVWRLLIHLGPFRVHGPGYDFEAERYNQLIEEYKLRSDWKEFVLI